MLDCLCWNSNSRRMRLVYLAHLTWRLCSPVSCSLLVIRICCDFSGLFRFWYEWLYEWALHSDTVTWKLCLRVTVLCENLMGYHPDLFRSFRSTSNGGIYLALNMRKIPSRLHMLQLWRLDHRRVHLDDVWDLNCWHGVVECCSTNLQTFAMRSLTSQSRHKHNVQLGEHHVCIGDEKNIEK
jgi:hypothetical protein